jgi:tetratricopeptide (TPR) repeat protein
VLEKVPLLVLTAVFCGLAIWSYGSDVADLFAPRLPLLWRIETVPISYVNYLGMFFYPVGLAIPYPYPSLDLSFWKVFGAVMVLIAFTSAALAWRQRCPYLLVGWLWYLGMLVPVSGLLQFGAHTMIADRFTYLPQIGICVALTWGLADAVRSLPHRRLVCSVGAALILVVLMGCAWRQTSFWRDNETLWNRTLACTPPSRLAHRALGDAFLGLGQIDKAIEQYQTAIATEPDHATDCATSHSQLHYNFGVALASAGRLDEAIEQYQRAVQLRPNDVAAHNNLGNALLIRGQLAMGLSHCREALRIDPEFAEAHFNIGNVLYYRGRVDEAIVEYRKALKTKPAFAEAHYGLGIALAKCGQLDDAIAEYRKALQIDPHYEDARRNLSIALRLKQRTDNATEDQQAIAGKRSMDCKKGEEADDSGKTHNPGLPKLFKSGNPSPSPM